MSKEIMLQLGRDGVMIEYEKPYTTIECETAEDYSVLLELIEKGKQMEELEKENKLAKLPFGKGQTVYTFYSYDEVNGEKVEGVEENEFIGIFEDIDGSEICLLKYENNIFEEYLNEVFDSRQEAEKALNNNTN